MPRSWSGRARLTISLVASLTFSRLLQPPHVGESKHYALAVPEGVLGGPRGQSPQGEPRPASPGGLERAAHLPVRGPPTRAALTACGTRLRARSCPARQPRTAFARL